MELTRRSGRGLWRGAGAVLAASALVACAASSPAGDQSAIGVAGGAVTARSGAAAGARIDVPAGALDSTVTITLREGATASDLPAGSSAVGPVVVFGPEGQTFATPVTITLPTTSEATTVYTRPLGGATWTEVPGAEYDAARRVIIARVSHFSEFVPAHAGSPCRADADCAVGLACVMGRCRPAAGDGGAGCASGTTRCGMACVDLTSDPANCGACGNACGLLGTCTRGVCGTPPPPPDGGPAACRSDADCPRGTACRAGVCTASSGCPAGTMACGMTCADLTSDPRNCGACGSACAPGAACTRGVCGMAPPPDGGLLACRSDADCARGMVCRAGTCVASSGCPAGTILCGMTCADVTSDPAHCGMCGAACRPGTSCVRGACL